MDTNKESQIEVKIATIEDKEQVVALMDENAEEIGNFEKSNYQKVQEKILNDIDLGFFLLAQTQDKKPAGFMFFTYEWSDWRNGLFFWMQSVHVQKDFRKAGVFTKMQEFLNNYMKEQGCCGIRLASQQRLKQQWTPILKKMGLKPSHYYIYAVDTV